ncbi:MAG: alpha/beta hydrolase [Clostridia bacterium]|nr:alpha/beta hydrolase [Clostridia bacterium]
MKIEVMNLWNKIPGENGDVPTITAYIPENKMHNGAVVVFAGGGYGFRSPHEGEGYAKFLAENGICAFDVAYRVAPYEFPIELLDARRSVKFVRHFADKYGIDKDKIAVMGSSAGGHLAALCSTYKKDIDFEVENDEIEKEDFLPNAQILCYPVVKLSAPIGHQGSGDNLMGGKKTQELENSLTPDLIADDSAPRAFIWHTFTDELVNVINSLGYAKKLKEAGGSVELHIFPDGDHGMGLSQNKGTAVGDHVSQWNGLLLNWLKYIGF